MLLMLFRQILYWSCSLIKELDGEERFASIYCVFRAERINRKSVSCLSCVSTQYIFTMLSEHCPRSNNRSRSLLAQARFSKKTLGTQPTTVIFQEFRLLICRSRDHFVRTLFCEGFSREACHYMVVLISTFFLLTGIIVWWSCLGGRGGELCHGFSALGDGVLGKLSWKEEAHCCLDLPGRKCCLFVVSRQLGCLSGESVKDVVDERV